MCLYLHIHVYSPKNKLTQKLTYMKNKDVKGALKRTQKDYSLAFKLQVVHEIEKGRLTYKESQRSMASMVKVLFWFGCENVVSQIGNLKLP